MTRRAGFTLLELLAVLAILSILAVFVVTQIGTAEEIVQEKLVRAQLEQIDLAIAHYEAEEGDWPPSSFDLDAGAAAGEAPNAVNAGCERLVLALWSGGLEGCGLSADELANTDGDRTSRPLGDLPTKDLLELVDAWGNPIAYFHHVDYGTEALYRVVDATTGEAREVRVAARRNDATGLPFAHRRFQLISAGADGVFGSEDDLTNF